MDARGEPRAAAYTWGHRQELCTGLPWPSTRTTAALTPWSGSFARWSLLRGVTWQPAAHYIQLCSVVPWGAFRRWFHQHRVTFVHVTTIVDTVLGMQKCNSDDMQRECESGLHTWTLFRMGSISVRQQMEIHTATRLVGNATAIWRWPLSTRSELWSSFTPPHPPKENMFASNA
jgi:hypothetical protein